MKAIGYPCTLGSGALDLTTESAAFGEVVPTPTLPPAYETDVPFVAHGALEKSEFGVGVKSSRGAMLARLRRLIRKVPPELTEEGKWDTPVWSYNRTVVAAGVFKDRVKLNNFKGASLKDPKASFTPDSMPRHHAGLTGIKVTGLTSPG